MLRADALPSGRPGGDAHDAGEGSRRAVVRRRGAGAVRRDRGRERRVRRIQAAARKAVRIRQASRQAVLGLARREPHGNETSQLRLPRQDGVGADPLSHPGIPLVRARGVRADVSRVHPARNRQGAAPQADVRRRVVDRRVRRVRDSLFRAGDAA